jgi:hypothetical protein
MKIYISVDDKKAIKQNYPDLFDKNLAIIDVKFLIEKYNYHSYDDICADYVFINEIENLITYYYNNNKINKLLYIIENIDIGFVSNFKSYIESKGIYFQEYILIDITQNIYPKVYKYFDNVF